MTEDTIAKQSTDLAFERKVRLARWAIVFERLWVRLWAVLAVGGLFLLTSLAGVWPLLGDWAHGSLLALFAALMLAAIVHLCRVPWPSRDEAIRRIERVSGARHRPASSYEDTLTAGVDDPTTRAVWRAHRARMAEALKRLRPGGPRPRTDRYDPLAIRALGALALIVGVAFAGDAVSDRLRSAFRLASAERLNEARLDVWMTPPPYTSRPPVMLSDGANPIGAAKAKSDAPDAALPEVPERSVVIARASGLGDAKLALEIVEDGKPSSRAPAEVKAGGNDVQEARFELRRAATIRALADETAIAEWNVHVTPDNPPTIALTKKPEVTLRGSLKLNYKVEDDYGVTRALGKLEKVPQKKDAALSWADPPPPKGPRPPLTRPPMLELRLPQANAKSAEAQSFLELASHPWAGLRVLLTLEATDVAGQTGKAEPIELVLPERRFTKPLARAVIEQRRKLMDDPRYRGQVLKAIDALTLAPEDYFDDTRVYLGLRTAFHRLERDTSRAGMKSVIDQLWYVALRIEDGDLSDAERALRDVQDRLTKALEEGASEDEIKRLMEELKQAFNEFMQQLAKKSDEQNQDGTDDQNQQFGQQDLEQMMKNLEDMAKDGSREEAQKMLGELRDLMERLQAGRMDKEQMQKSQQMNQMMEKLAKMVGDQQKLLDDTFNEQRRQGEEDGGRQLGGQNQPGNQAGGQRQGKKGQQQGQRGPGQKGQRGQPTDDPGEGMDPGDGMAPGQLGSRQRELRDRLAQLQQEMRDSAANAADKLKAARESMENAEQALEAGDMESASESQAQALQQMRDSAQSLAQQMQANSPQRYGQNGKTPRDPLGRPQKTQGPDLGTSVKVPDQIDMQRAREILEELRRRIGEATRPAGEIDYLERLQRRF